MRLIEFRILMPLTVEENYIGQLWSFAEMSRLNTRGGEGVEILKNELFQLPDHTLNDIYKYLPEYDGNPQDTNTDINNGNQNNTSNSKYKMQVSLSFGALKNIIVKRNSSSDNVTTSNNGNNTAIISSQQQNGFKSNEKRQNSEHKLTKSESLNTNQSFDNVSKSIDIVQFDTNSSQNDIIKSRTGQYTYKVYRLTSKFPWYVQKILPKDSLSIHEKSWNMYPIIKTHISNDYMKDKFHVRIDTISKDYINGKFEDNVHNLTQEQLDRREIVFINIAENVPTSEYIEDEDPSKFKSKLTNRGPLQENWYLNQQPIICCYKLVDFEFAWFGIQTKAENHMANFYKKVFNRFHRQVFCWLDKWYNMKIEDIRKYELELQQSLVEQIKHGEIADLCIGDVVD